MALLRCFDKGIIHRAQLHGLYSRPRDGRGIVIAGQAHVCDVPENFFLVFLIVGLSTHKALSNLVVLEQSAQGGE